MERFSCGTEVVSGEGALGALEKWRGKRLLLVTQPFLEQDGTAERVLRAAGIQQSRTFLVTEELPTVSLAAEGAARLKEFSPDVVAALGDSCVGDCAGMMAFFGKRGCPVVAVPTLPWGGGETAGHGELTHDRLRYALADRSLQPVMAILEPTLGQPFARNAVAERGFGVLANALEACSAPDCGVFGELLAREAFRSARAALPAACAGRTSARQQLAVASAMAGMAWNRSGLGLCHALSGVLGSMFRVAPGRLKGVLLPAVMDCNAHGAGRKYAELSRSAGLGGGTEAAAVRNLREGLIRLRQELDLPRSLAQAGLHPGSVWAKAGQIAEQTLKSPVLKGNPVAVDDFMIRRILEEATGRI